MPIYEYQCGACGERMEKLQRMSDDRLVDCPACGKPALQRLVSAAAFRLKGGGWYETDFKKDNKRNLADAGSSGAASDSAGGSPGGKTGGTTGGTSGDKSSSSDSASGSSATGSGSSGSSSSGGSSDGGSKKAETKPAAKSSSD